MKKSVIIFPALLVFLLLSACSSIKDAAGQVGNWAKTSLEEVITQANDGISISALGGFGAGAMIEARLNELNNDNTEEIAAARLEEILEAIDNQDSETIYDMFSVNARNEAVDLRERIYELFCLMDGSVISWERALGSADIQTHHGSQLKQYGYVFDVHTSEKDYVFSITEYLVDSDTPDNIGLYRITAYDLERIDELSTFTEPGIYLLD